MEQATSILIIDDEAVAIGNLQHIIQEFCAGFEVVGLAQNVTDGLEMINSLKPKIVLLDIEMPGETGFYLLDQVQDRSFEVIFVTAYNQYAIKAFKYAAVDYLLKPVDIDELQTALDRARDRRERTPVPSIDFGKLMAGIQGLSSNKLAVHSLGETELVDIDEIVRMEANGSYTDIFISKNKKLMASKTLKEYETLLADDGFFRAHNAHLINMSYIKKYIKKDGFSVLMDDGTTVPIAVRRKELFEELLKKISR